MTLFQHMQLVARRGLSDIDRDRDAAISFEARYGGSPELDVYLHALAEQRALQLLVLDGLDELRRLNHPALRQDVRPDRMAKASLRAVQPALRTGTHR